MSPHGGSMCACVGCGVEKYHTHIQPCPKYERAQDHAMLLHYLTPTMGSVNEYFLKYFSHVLFLAFK